MTEVTDERRILKTVLTPDQKLVVVLKDHGAHMLKKQVFVERREYRGSNRISDQAYVCINIRFRQ